MKNKIYFIASLLGLLFFCQQDLRAQQTTKIITAFPYAESFDSLNPCLSSSCVLDSAYGWVNVTTDDMDFSVIRDTTPSSLTGPHFDYSLGYPGNGKYLYVEASGNYSKTADLLSPVFVMDSLQNPVLRFAYHMYGVSMGNLTLEVIVNGHGHDIWSQKGSTGIFAWQIKTIDLTPYLGDTVQFKFTALTGTGFSSDIAIDEFRIEDDCNNGLVRPVRRDYLNPLVEFSIMDPNMDSCLVEYGPSGFTIGSGTSVVKSTSSFSINNLNNMVYDFY